MRMELTHPNSFYWPLGFNQLGHPQPTTQPVGVGCPNSSMGTHPIFGLNSMPNMVNTTATIKCDCTSEEGQRRTTVNGIPCKKWTRPTIHKLPLQKMDHTNTITHQQK